MKFEIQTIVVEYMIQNSFVQQETEMLGLVTFCFLFR